MTDRIFISGLSLHAYHGVMPYEGKVGQTFTIDMVLGLTRPDSGSVSLFGMSPAAAVAAGAIGGMLQTGSLIEYLSVRELVTMIASVYPRPLEVERVLRLTGAMRRLSLRPRRTSTTRTWMRPMARFMTCSRRTRDSAPQLI